MPSGLPRWAYSYSFEYNGGMYQIETTAAFDAWLDGLKDSLTRKRLGLRLRKAELGNLGDIKPVGDGVWEMREFFGPGWRMYYIQQGSVLIVMVGVATNPASLPILLPRLRWPVYSRSSHEARNPSIRHHRDAAN